MGASWPGAVPKEISLDLGLDGGLGLFLSGLSGLVKNLSQREHITMRVSGIVMQCLHVQMGVEWGVPLHTVPGPCGLAGCGLDPFTSPNVIIPWVQSGAGLGRGPAHPG